MKNYCTILLIKPKSISLPTLHVVIKPHPGWDFNPSSFQNLNFTNCIYMNTGDNDSVLRKNPPGRPTVKGVAIVYG